MKETKARRVALKAEQILAVDYLKLNPDLCATSEDMVGIHDPGSGRDEMRVVAELSEKMNRPVVFLHMGWAFMGVTTVNYSVGLGYNYLPRLYALLHPECGPEPYYILVVWHPTSDDYEWYDSAGVKKVQKHITAMFNNPRSFVKLKNILNHELRVYEKFPEHEKLFGEDKIDNFSWMKNWYFEHNYRPVSFDLMYLLSELNLGLAENVVEQELLYKVEDTIEKKQRDENVHHAYKAQLGDFETNIESTLLCLDQNTYLIDLREGMEVYLYKKGNVDANGYLVPMTFNLDDLSILYELIHGGEKGNEHEKHLKVAILVEDSLLPSVLTKSKYEELMDEINTYLSSPANRAEYQNYIKKRRPLRYDFLGEAKAYPEPSQEKEINLIVPNHDIVMNVETVHQMNICYYGDPKAVFFYDYGNPIVAVHKDKYKKKRSGEILPAHEDSEFLYFTDFNFDDALMLCKEASPELDCKLTNKVIEKGEMKYFATFADDKEIGRTDISDLYDVASDMAWNLASLLFFQDIFVKKIGNKEQIEAFDSATIYSAENRDEFITQMILDERMQVLVDEQKVYLLSFDEEVYSDLYKHGISMRKDKVADKIVCCLNQFTIQQLCCLIDMLNEELGEEVQIVKRETNGQEIYQIYLGDKHIYTTDPSVYDVATFDEEAMGDIEMVLADLFVFCHVFLD